MCNLKSNKTVKEILAYKKIIPKEINENIDLVLFPSAIYLSFFYDAPYKIGSQNISVYESGSITGEILANQLKSLKVSYVLVNHFEMKETLENTLKKIKNATKQKIKVVLCIGEKEKQTMDETLVEITKEITKVFDNLTKKERENLIIAYEPCWAISKQDIINTKIINSIAKKLKKQMKEKYDVVLDVLYGGGITTKNIKDLENASYIDGYLLGNCANIPENVCKILDIL